MAIYLVVTVDAPARASELAQALLHLHEPLGLELRKGAKGRELTLAYFSDVDEALAAKARVAAALPKVKLELSQLVDRDWTESFRKLRRPIVVGRLCVLRPEEVARAPRGQLPVLVPAGEAFGNGDHPTTWMCLEALDGFLATQPGASVLDVGTGTGILAIAARKLGAGRVLGIDIRPASVDEALANARLNDAAALELTTTPVGAVAGQFDLVIANMLAELLIALAPEIAPRVGRQLLLSGMLVHQWEQVEAAYVAQGLRSEAIQGMGQWVRLTLRAGR